MGAVVRFNISDFKTAYKIGMDFFNEQAGGTDIGKKLKLAYEEVFVNVLRENENSNAEVSVEIEKLSDRLEVCIRDNGIEFDPLKKKDPDITLSAEERGVGGLGIFLFKQLTDYADYEYKESFNILTFGKYISENERVK